MRPASRGFIMATVKVSIWDMRETLLHGILFFSAAAAMVSFYFTSSYSATLWMYLRCVVVGVVIAVPDWVFFCRSPLGWLQPLGNERSKRTRPSCKKVAESMAPFSFSSLQCLPTSAMLASSR